MYVRMCILCMYIMCVCMCVCMYVCMYYMYGWMYGWMDVCMYVCMYVSWLLFVVQFDLDELKGDKGGSLTRSYNPGFWGWILVEDNYYKINVKVGRLQIDNQLRDYTLDSRIIFASEKIIVPEHSN